MTKREKAGMVLVITGFLLVLFGCCLVADNPYWWVSVVISGAGCGLIALAVFVLPKEDEPQQDKRLVIEDENHKVVLVAPLTDFELAYLRAVKLGKDDENGRLH